ncbi:uncharacterized protein MAL8P1.12-like [Uloborus diversus]|uniref:uncharacterized protein MAL8P1.12-like n=1 Tax=Uloborus diversus TaxID=327109 RepID=UPI0024099B54|nr:uncharacterized protein MAL8P1.12-like [Uloborus diversus]
MPTSDESDNVSIKLLLKQVYTVHNSKVKELENEVKDLKEKLLEKEKQLNDVQSNCKKCCELEEVIKSCKATLHEQSKLFENLGQKFSVFDNSEKEQHGNQISKNLTIGLQNSVSASNEEAKNNVEGENILEEQFCQSLCFTDTVVNVQNVKQNLLQNVMIDTLEEPLGLGSIINPSTLMPNDSLILAPDTLDIDINVKAETSKNVHKDEKNVKKADLHSKQYFKEQNSFIESTKDSSIKSTRKRLSSESCMDKTSKKCKKEIDSFTQANENECSKILVPTVHSSVIPSYNLHNNANSEVSKAESKIMSSNTKEVLLLETDQKKDSSENAMINSKKLVDSPFSTLDCSKENANLASPSLLPLVTNHNQVNDAADSDDFQPSSSKYKENSSLKEVSDKKKCTKKIQGMKSVKTSSKFKMTLDAPPLDYKKPNYRQTKLSKTIFQPLCPKKSKNTALEKSLLEKEVNAKIEDEEIVITSPTLHEVQNFRSKKESKTMDFDATCIPENFKFEFTPCGKLSSKQSEQNKLSFDENILVLDNKSENKILRLPCENDMLKTSSKSAQEIGRNADSLYEDENNHAKENMNSFDRLPFPEEPKYKYKEETVRKKAERRQLVGYDCKECEKYYSDLGLSEKEKQQRLKKCSRHRAKFVPPSTPEHFWELDFPDTQECKTRGYLNATQKMKLNFLTS